MFEKQLFVADYDTDFAAKYIYNMTLNVDGKSNYYIKFFTNRDDLSSVSDVDIQQIIKDWEPGAFFDYTDWDSPREEEGYIHLGDGYYTWDRAELSIKGREPNKLRDSVIRIRSKKSTAHYIVKKINRISLWEVELEFVSAANDVWITTLEAIYALPKNERWIFGDMLLDECDKSVMYIKNECLSYRPSKQMEKLLARIHKPFAWETSITWFAKSASIYELKSEYDENDRAELEMFIKMAVEVSTGGKVYLSGDGEFLYIHEYPLNYFREITPKSVDNIEEITNEIISGDYIEGLTLCLQQLCRERGMK